MMTKTKTTLVAAALLMSASAAFADEAAPDTVYRPHAPVPTYQPMASANVSAPLPIFDRVTETAWFLHASHTAV